MIYFDNGATTWPKPPSVRQSVLEAMERYGANPGRAGHEMSIATAVMVTQTRERAAQLFDLPQPEQVIFTQNCTHGLNIAIKTLVHPGDRVVISGYEHNAVTRPLHAIPEVEILVARSPLFDRQGMIDSFRQCLDQGADAAICTHVSNVFGFILPIQEIAELCRQREVPLIVDASQSAGVLPLDIQELGAAFVAMPGHKGLYGPQGTGLLLCNRDPTPILEGGTGSESLKQSMPQFLPDRLEAGTHNIAGVAGLLEGLRFLRRRDIRWIAGHESRLIQRMGNGLSRLPGVEVFQASMPKAQSGVLSFRIKGRDCEDVGEALGDRGFALRAGLHCAPEAHRTAGTLETGTVRASVSAFNTEMEIDRFLRAIGDMVRR